MLLATVIFCSIFICLFSIRFELFLREILLLTRSNHFSDSLQLFSTLVKFYLPVASGTHHLVVYTNLQ